MILLKATLKTINSYMPRRKLIRQRQFPYHITTRTNNKDWFQIPQPIVWDVCKESFLYAQKRNIVDLHCFVLMGNHYHMLITTPNSDIDSFMKNFNLQLSKLITKSSGVINHKFSNRYKWTIVSNQSYLLNVYRYIYQNPVRANITQDCFSYPYSSLHFTKDEAKLLNYKPHLEYSKETSWMELRYGKDFDNIIRKSLRKKEFTPGNKTSTFFTNILNGPKQLNN